MRTQNRTQIYSVQVKKQSKKMKDYIQRNNDPN